MDRRIRVVRARRYRLFPELEDAMCAPSAEETVAGAGPDGGSEAPADGSDDTHPLVFSRGDDHASLVDFAARIATRERPVPVAVHPYGRYRFERPRADRIDAELGVALRLIDPALFGADAPAIDRPWLPLLGRGAAPSRSDALVLGYRPRDGHAAEAALVERVVQAVIAGRDGAVWRLDPSVCALYVDHLDPDFGGYRWEGLEAMAHGAACLGAAVRVGPHVEAFWPRPPVVVVRDADALARELAALLDDRERLHALRVASWEWARDVASYEPGQRRVEAWVFEAMDRVEERASVAPAPIWRPTDAPRVACAVIARATDALSQASLRAALRSVEAVTDECVVVLDERSAPEADAMLEALGARVVRRAWTDDFAAARNALHEHVRAPWLLVIDSDEVLVSAGDLARAIATADADGHQAVMARVRTVGDAGVGEVLWQFRVYRKSACRWEYPVHNELVGIESVVPTTALFHASYVGTAEEKAARSLPLLHAQAEREPENARWAHFLAQTYHAIGDTARMVEWSRRCVERAPAEGAFVHRWCDLALARFAEQGASGEALDTILEAARRHPTHPDVWHVLATMALAEWHRAAGGPPTLSPVRSGHHAKNLPSVASALGLPLEHSARAPRAPAPEPSAGRSSTRVTEERRIEPGDRLRIAFVCGGGTRFLTGIEDALEARHEVRRLHFTERAALRDIDAAMGWADVVWFEWCDELLVEASRRLEKRARVVCRLHGYEAFTDLPGRVRWDFVDRLVLVSEATRRLFESRFGDKTSCVVVPNAIDTDRLRLSTTGDPFALAFLGYLNHKKSPELLLQGMAELVRRDPRYHLHVGGTFQDLAYERYLDKMLPALGLADHVTMHGWIEDVDAWLHDKSLIVSTSVTESFGVGIAEGMAKGLTPVIHDWVGAEELWPREHLSRTVAELADLVQRGSGEPAALRAWVTERYDRAKVARRIDALLCGLCAGEGGVDG